MGLSTEISITRSSSTMSEQPVSSSKGWVKVGEDPDRHGSFSSAILQQIVDNDVMDSIEFSEAIPDTTKGEKSPAYPPATEPPPKAPSHIQNIILASKALRKMGLDKNAFILRRQALSLGPFRNKVDFAKVFVDLKLPETNDTGQGRASTLSNSEACMDYVLAKVKEAIEELEKLGFGKDERIAKIRACFAEFRASKTSKDGAD